MPLVTDLYNAQMKALGRTVNNHLCEHFAHTRKELFDIIKIKKIKTFSALIAEHGKGNGCEICKPTVASIIASLFNETIVDTPHLTLQDTNDRFLANMQRGGLYSVVPRVPGGEITPDKLIVLGEVAKKFDLYTKITGGQRIDLFGAKMQDLPGIWEELIEAGFESGHAYGKALRTVKSCVGTSWCRFGMQDSVKFAVEVEHRYRGIRAPHKVKMAVSGCTRECAEAQCKDVGLIATEMGYNLYVCGNGGATPRHADLIATDLDEATALKLIDRFMMYYVQTADRLTRTSVWLEKLEGGLEHLKAVIIDDKLGICDELEKQMQFLVDTYRCEWKAVVEDPEKRRLFRQFINTDENEPCIEMVDERGQPRPEYWSKNGGVHRLEVDDKDGKLDGVLHTEAAPRGPNAALHSAQSLAVGVAGLEASFDEFFPDARKILHFGSEEIDALAACYLGVKVEFFGHLAQHDQLIRRDLAARDARDHGIEAAALHVGKETVVCVLQSQMRSVDDRFIEQARDDRRDGWFANFTAVAFPVFGDEGPRRF